MQRFEFIEALRKLRLSPKQAAILLSVDPKTTLRWLERNAQVPGPAEQALRAWMRLEALGLPWRPNETPIGMSNEDIAKQIHLLREHNLALDEIIRRVQARGGPTAPWKVDLDRRQAELAEILVVYFYVLPNGGFSPSGYSRSDREADYARDKILLEDAIACIADAIGTVGPNWHQRRIPES